MKKLVLILSIIGAIAFSGCSSKPSDPEGILKHYIENVIKTRDLRGAEEYYTDKHYAQQNIAGKKRNFENDYYGEDLDDLEYKMKIIEEDKNRVKIDLRMRNTSHKEPFYRDWNMKFTVIFENINGGWKIYFFQ